jgi:hypothetical protein
MGGQHRLEHRAADSAPAPAPALEFAAAPEQIEAPFPIPGLSTAEPIRRSASAADPLGGASVDAGTEQALQTPAGGSKLDDSVRSSMESAFNTDFSDVRVHSDASAANLSRSMQATAFTHGSNIFFSEGSYNPSSESGKHLLAHELTHVVQRKQGRDTGAPSLSATTTIGKADDPLETEAEAVATDVVGALKRQAKDCDCGQPH